MHAKSSLMSEKQAKKFYEIMYFFTRDCPNSSISMNLNFLSWKVNSVSIAADIIRCLKFHKFKFKKHYLATVSSGLVLFRTAIETSFIKASDITDIIMKFRKNSHQPKVVSEKKDQIKLSKELETKSRITKEEKEKLEAQRIKQTKGLNQAVKKLAIIVKRQIRVCKLSIETVFKAAGIEEKEVKLKGTFFNNFLYELSEKTKCEVINSDDRTAYIIPKRLLKHAKELKK